MHGKRTKTTTKLIAKRKADFSAGTQSVKDSLKLKRRKFSVL